MTSAFPTPEQVADRRAALLAEPRRLLSTGAWVTASGGGTCPTHDPATGQLLAQIAEGRAEDIDLAVAAARRAFDGPWRRFTPFERQEVMLRFCDLIDRHWNELCLLDTLDMGVPFGRDRRQIIGRLRFCAGLTTAINGESISPSAPGEYHAYTVSEPVGVVGAIIPWNGPMGATVWKIGPVLATGCTLVLKPAEEASLTPLRMTELAMEAGVPPGVINVVTGFGETAGAALTRHPGVDKIAFTGSNETGRRIVEASAATMKRLSLELGGKSANIVFADADLDAAVEGAAMAVFANCGQVCSAGTRLFVERPIHDAFVARLAAHAGALRVGPGTHAHSRIGPLGSARQLDRVLDYIAIGQAEGARLALGGERLRGGNYDAGHFVSPTIFADVTDQMRIAREEIFGPVLAVLPFDTLEEAAERANNSPFGLGAGIWTKDLSTAHRLAARLRTGSVWVNCYNLYDAALPFGGFKESGYGRESGIQHLQAYLETKAVTVRLS